MGAYPVIMGQDVQLFCNTTEVGHPATVRKYAWLHDNVELHNSSKYLGVNAKQLTILVSSMGFF